MIDGMARIAGPDERASVGAAMSPASTIPGCSSSAWRFSADALKLASQPALRPGKSRKKSWTESRIG